MDNVELVHWGVKGMRWGVRRYQNKDGSLTPAGKKRLDKEMSKLSAEKKKLRNQERTKAKLAKLKATQDEVEARKKSLQEDNADAPKKRTIKDMSDAELREKINRLDLERRYSELMTKSATKEVSKGKKFVMDIIETSGKNIGTQLATYALGTAVNKIFDDTIVNPKKGQKDK